MAQDEFLKVKGIVIAKKANYYIVQIDLKEYSHPLTKSREEENTFSFLCTLYL